MHFDSIKYSSQVHFLIFMPRFKQYAQQYLLVIESLHF